LSTHNCLLVFDLGKTPSHEAQSGGDVVTMDVSSLTANACY